MLGTQTNIRQLYKKILKKASINTLDQTLKDRITSIMETLDLTTLQDLATTKRMLTALKERFFLSMRLSILP